MDKETVVKVNICWGKNIIQSEWQKKVFKDSIAALEFCRKHYGKIQWVNGLRTNGEPVNHFDLACAIENPEDK